MMEPVLILLVSMLLVILLLYQLNEFKVIFECELTFG